MMQTSTRPTDSTQLVTFAILSVLHLLEVAICNQLEMVWSVGEPINLI